MTEEIRNENGPRAGDHGGQQEASANIEHGSNNAGGAAKQGKIREIADLNTASKSAAALAYAAYGWRVFPLHTALPGGCTCGNPACGKSAGKHPRTARGQNDATNDAATIRKWWKAWPDANIGLHCAASGMVVLDIDPRNGGDVTFAALEAQHGAITSPLTSDTGGGGRHLFFAAPDGAFSHAPLGYGIDFKWNGYVILPPSNHASGRMYQWREDAGFPIQALPAWIVHPREVAARHSCNKEEINFNDLCEAVFALPPEYYMDGSYPEWFRIGVAIFHATDGSDAGLYLFDQWSSQGDCYKPGECARKWRNFRYSHPRGEPVTADTIFWAARAAGWRPWAEIAMYPPWGYRGVHGEDALCLATFAIEQGEYAALRGHVFMIACEVVIGNLKETFAFSELLHAARYSLSHAEMQSTWEGAMRCAPQEVALQRMLEEERRGIFIGIDAE